MNYPSFSLLFGFSVWFLATLSFRVLGHTFFLIDNTMLMGGFFLATVPLLYVLMNQVFNHYQLSGSDLLNSSVLMAVPGMLGDVFCVKLHEVVFPTLNVDQVIVLSAWVLWAYVIVLLIGLIQSKRFSIV